RAVEIAENGQGVVHDLDGPHPGLPGDGPQERHLVCRVLPAGTPDVLPRDPAVCRIVTVPDDLAVDVPAHPAGVRGLDVHLYGDRRRRGLLDTPVILVPRRV